MVESQQDVTNESFYIVLDEAVPEIAHIAEWSYARNPHPMHAMRCESAGRRIFWTLHPRPMPCEPDAWPFSQSRLTNLTISDISDRETPRVERRE